MGWTPYRAFDLTAMGLLDAHWAPQIEAVAQQEAMLTWLDGRSATSRETDSNTRIPIRVVTGERIRAMLPWLYQLYERELRDLAATVAECPMFTATDVVSAVNINYMLGNGARYEWHVDSNPLTGLLFATTLEAGQGGELIFRSGHHSCLVRPRKGLFIAFDARHIEHSVLPLVGEQFRISVPMNYYHSPTEQSRPEDLDRYLYGATP